MWLLGGMPTIGVQVSSTSFPFCYVLEFEG
jgi:hypothetical protein